jgi:WD40 repeat protein
MISTCKRWHILAVSFVLWSGTSSTQAGERITVRIQHGLQVRSVVFSPDGKTLASGAGDRKVCLWDAVSGKKLKEFGPLLGSIRAVAFAPDGKTLAAASSERAIVLWDVASGRERDRWVAHRSWVTAVAFVPDGKSLISCGEDGMVRLWNLAGREIRSFGGLMAGASSIALAPDGKLLASGDRNNMVHIWETATAKELFQLAGHRSPVTQLAFSPDGKSLASAGQENEIRLWEVTTGSERCRLCGGEFMIFCIAFSPDGRILVTGGMDKIVHRWDVATCQPLPDLTGHASAIAALSIAGDGRHLATASHDGAIFIWDMPGQSIGNKAPAQDLSSKELETRWNELATQDASRAYQAIWRLALAPEPTLSFLKARLHIGPAPEASLSKRISRLIADLDSDEFTVRERATRELEKLGDSAASSLSGVQAGKPSAETRHRVEEILAKIAPKKSRLQQLRAVEILEHIGTAEAQEMLKQLCQGTADIGLAHDAKAALQRLAKRPSS